MPQIQGEVRSLIPKLKIMQVVHSLRRGGAERVLLELSDGLRRRGHDVQIVCLLKQNEYTEEEYLQLGPHSLINIKLV